MYPPQKIILYNYSGVEPQSAAIQQKEPGVF